MRYAIERQDGVFIQDGNTPFPAGAVYPAPLDYIPPRYYKIVNGQVVEKTDEEKQIVDLPLKYRRYENNAWRRLTAEEQLQVEQEDILLLPEKYRKFVDGIWVELTQEEKDIVDQNEAIVAEESMQNNKPLALKKAENNFLLMCDLLTGSTEHNKVGFADLNTIIEAISDDGTKLMTAVKLLAIDAECKREGGLLWWDTCKWHNDISQ